MTGFPKPKFSFEDFVNELSADLDPPDKPAPEQEPCAGGGKRCQLEAAFDGCSREELQDIAHVLAHIALGSDDYETVGHAIAALTLHPTIGEGAAAFGIQALLSRFLGNIGGNE